MDVKNEEIRFLNEQIEDVRENRSNRSINSSIVNEVQNFRPMILQLQEELQKLTEEKEALVKENSEVKKENGILKQEQEKLKTAAQFTQPGEYEPGNLTLITDAVQDSG